MDTRDATIKIVPENRTFICSKQYIGTAINIFIFAVIAYNYADTHFFETTIFIFCIFYCRKA